MAVGRDEIEDKYKWDLNDLMPSLKEYDEIFSEVEKLVANIPKYRGQLGERKKMLEYFKLSDEIESKVERLYVYSHLKVDENQNISENTARKAKVYALLVKIEEISSFASVEITSLDAEFLRKTAKLEEFSVYDLILLRAIEEKEHILSENEEKLLAGLGEIFNTFHDIFTLTDNVDLKFEDVEDKDGKKPLNHSTYSLYLADGDRDLRRDAYNKYYAEYIQNLNHITATYVGNVKTDCFLAKTRKFPSALDKAMFSEEVDKKVYLTLLENISENCKYVHEYISLRKKVLKLENINFYDLYVSMVEGSELKLEYEDAVELVKKALLPLGEDYAEILQKGFQDRWVDVFYNEGKRSGAYSFGSNSCHPYVLLNYEKTSHDVFTIAHEMGHAIHSYWSSENQPSTKASYKIFVAEVASTVNEVLLLKHLISSTDDEKFKKFCLNYFLDMFRTTIFRQTMFAEFEAKAHEMCENGEEMTKDSFSREYDLLNRKYYGEEIVHDDNIKTEWARIPHFYRSFYVYKYATGLISAISIAYGILENKEGAVENYKKFLKSGCSDTPTNLLKIAGVDLETDEPFQKAMNVMIETLGELKSIL